MKFDIKSNDYHYLNAMMSDLTNKKVINNINHSNISLAILFSNIENWVLCQDNKELLELLSRIDFDRDKFLDLLKDCHNPYHNYKTEWELKELFKGNRRNIFKLINIVFNLYNEIKNKFENQEIPEIMERLRIDEKQE